MAELLPDPCDDRVMKEVLPPPHVPLPHNKLFQKNGLPDWKLLRDHLKKEGKLEKADILELIKQFQNTVKNEPVMLKLQDPVTVVGDIHGQFYDLLKLLDLGGNPEKTKYLFLGDYVDRGSFSIECAILLIAIKLNFKSTINMLRGNHECRQMTSFFNFKQECEVKYDKEVYDRFMDAFDCLPLSCLINEKLSPFMAESVRNLKICLISPKFPDSMNLLKKDSCVICSGVIPAKKTRTLPI